MISWGRGLLAGLIRRLASDRGVALDSHKGFSGSLRNRNCTARQTVEGGELFSDRTQNPAVIFSGRLVPGLMFLLVMGAFCESLNRSRLRVAGMSGV